MVLVVGGVPVGRKISKQQLLPQIPHNGPAARLSPRVLLSKIEENISERPNTASGRAALEQKKQYIWPFCDGSTAQPLGAPTSPHLRPAPHKLHKMLYEKDHVHVPAVLDSLLVSCNVDGVAMEHDVDLGADLFPDAQEEDRVPTNASQRGPNGKYADGYLRPLLEGAAGLETITHNRQTHKRMPPTGAALVRQQHLSASFRHTKDEIAARMLELDEHLLLKDKNSLDPMAVQNVPDDSKDSPGEEVPELEELFDAFEKSAIGLIGPRSGNTPLKASSEEVTLSIDVLNLHRWLCGLQPVSFHKDYTHACEILSETLLPRISVFIRPSNPQFQQIIQFGNMLIKHMGSQNQSIVLQGDASLISSVAQCIVAGHMEANAIHPACMPSPAGWEDMIGEVRDRATRYRTGIVTEDRTGKSENDVWMPPDEKQEMLGLRSLPPALQHYQVFWTLTDTGALPTPRKPTKERWAARANLPVRELTRRLRHAQPPGKATPRSRSKALGEEQKRKERTKAKPAGAVFWGDREGKVSFRRFLLNPALEFFGASRINDNCTIWTGVEDDINARNAGVNQARQEVEEEDVLHGDLRAFHARRSRKIAESPTFEQKKLKPKPEKISSRRAKAEKDPDVVSYPPSGIFPHELLLGQMPSWTIMPDSRLYQPTQSLSVQMWRVRMTNLDGIHTHPWSAERVEEVAVLSLQCDCSAKGNPFCIIFKPDLQRIADGDQFEVELSGLRGVQPRMHFFHYFRSFRSERIDHHLLEAAEHVCALLNQPTLWAGPSKIVGPPQRASPSPERLLSPVSPLPGQLPLKFEPSPVPEIGLLSHDNLVFVTEGVDTTLTLSCPAAAVLKAQLCLMRVSGREEIRRATHVMKVRGCFVVRVKFPMAHCRYMLTFRVSLPAPANPEVFHEHPLRYTIITGEQCQNLLVSLDHPMKEKFGFVNASYACQLHGLTIIAPMEFRVRAGHVYFLVHIDPECKPRILDHDLETVPVTATTLFSHRLKPEPEAEASCQNLRRANGRASLLNYVEPAACVMTELQNNLRIAMEKGVQDVRDDVHLDLLVRTSGYTERYITRLAQRSDFPELFDGLLHFTDHDVDGRVEMYIRFPRSQASQYAPLKIAEWTITRKEEHFPMGF